MARRVDDAVHVQIEVVVLYAVGVGRACVGIHAHAAYKLRHRLDCIDDAFWVALAQPPADTQPSAPVRACTGWRAQSAGASTVRAPPATLRIRAPAARFASYERARARPALKRGAGRAAARDGNGASGPRRKWGSIPVEAGHSHDDLALPHTAEGPRPASARSGAPVPRLHAPARFPLIQRVVNWVWFFFFSNS